MEYIKIKFVNVLGVFKNIRDIQNLLICIIFGKIKIYKHVFIVQNFRPCKFYPSVKFCGGKNCLLC